MMRYGLKFHHYFIALIIFLSACSRVQVTTDHDKNADFTKYKTFDFTPLIAADQTPHEFNTIDQKRVRAAIIEEMQARGLKQADKGELMISIYMRVAEKQRVVGSTGYYGGPYYYGHYSGYSSGSVNTVDYKVGTLIVDVVDAKANNLIWQGVAEGTMPKKQPKNIEERIKKIVHQIFEKYPIPAATSH